MLNKEGLLGFFKHHLDAVLYIVFGVLTTAVNVVVYWLFAHPFGVSTVVSSVCAWFAAVLFAYVTNRKWVFHSEAEGLMEIVREIIAFFLSRLATGAVDWIGMFVLVDVLHLYDVVVKFGLNILVIILNFIASKLIVFRH